MISDYFTSEHVGFVPVGICFGSPEPFPVEPAVGNVTPARKHLSPAIPVTVVHPVSKSQAKYSSTLMSIVLQLSTRE